MAEYIKREAVRNAILGEHPDMHYPSWYTNIIDNIPTADVAPVIHAEWIETPFESIWPGDIDENGEFIMHTYMAWKCSRCGREITGSQHPNKEPYCHCGAKMDNYKEKIND